MNGLAAGVGAPIIGGAYLLINRLSQGTLFDDHGRLTTQAARGALTAFLLVVFVVFLYKKFK